MKTKFLILLISCFAFLSCSESKDDFPDELPAITEKGKDTAGCLVDGELLLKRGLLEPNSPPSVVVHNPTNERNFWMLKIIFGDNFFNNTSASLDIIVKSKEKFEKGRVYDLIELKNDDDNSADGSVFLKPKGATTFFAAKTNLNNKGTITLTKIVLEGDNPFISGTFAFEAESYDRIFNITEGRFDLKIDEIK